MSVEVKNLRIKVVISGIQTESSEEKNWTSKQVMEAIQKVNKNHKER